MPVVHVDAAATDTTTMVDAPASRPMESFFLNPTASANMQSQRPGLDADRRSILDHPSALTFASLSHHHEHTLLQQQYGPKNSSKDATIVDLINEPFFHHTSYASDEEAPSPADDVTDHVSLSSADMESLVTVDDEDDYENIDIDYDDSSQSIDNDEQQMESKPLDSKESDEMSLREDLPIHSSDFGNEHYYQAQVITFRSVGRPTIIFVPKLSDKPELMQRKTHVYSMMAGTSMSTIQIQQMQAQNEASPSNASSYSSPRSTDTKSTRSTPPTSFEQERSKRETYIRRPSVPLMMAAGDAPRTTTRPSVVVSQTRTSNSSRSDDKTTGQRLRSSSGKKLHKLSSSWSLGFKAQQSTRPNVGLSPKQLAPATPDTRRSSTARMVPRGATERAPAIIIPPCPEDDSDVEREEMSLPVRSRHRPQATTSNQPTTVTRQSREDSPSTNVRRDSAYAGPSAPNPEPRTLQRKPKLASMQ